MFDSTLDKREAESLLEKEVSREVQLEGLVGQRG